MDKIRAPYNFVPPASRPVRTDLELKDLDPGESSIELQDRPFRDGLSDTLTVTLETETPLFVRAGEGDRGADAFRLPDGTVALPGSSVRGLLRNVVEIASGSRLWLVNDHAYSIRDLTAGARPIYGEFMAEIRRLPGGKPQPTPLVSAGWLRRYPEALRAETRLPVLAGEEARDDDLVAALDVCDFSRVEYNYLIRLAETRQVRNYFPGERQRSLGKYKAFCRGFNDWSTAAKELHVGFDRAIERPRGDKSARGVPLPSEVSRVVKLDEPGRCGSSGVLVFTGQPNEYRKAERGARPGGNAKHHDFLFYRVAEVSYPRLEVSRSAFRAFEQVHADRGQQARLEESPNPEWKHWKERVYNHSDGTRADAVLDSASAVPVFFLPQAGPSLGLRAMGLAMMFRLAYEYGIHDAIEGAQSGAFELSPLDLATAVFGTVEEDNSGKTRALRGRVTVGVARAASPVKPLTEVRAILGAPRASFYPSYIQQGDVPGDRAPSGGYRTLMDHDVKARGWKRYRPHVEQPAAIGLAARSLAQGARGDEHNADVATSFKPIPAGTRFKVPVRFHNLRPFELGAILWAIDFGGDQRARHTLGMAKSLGYGRVKLTLDGHERELLSNDGSAVSLESCLDAFRAHMGPFMQSESIRQLIACAIPAPTDDLRHMLLRHPTERNEFVEAKRSSLALAPALPYLAAAAKPSVHSPGPGAARPAHPVPIPRPAPARPRGLEAGSRVTVEVLAERTKKGGVRVKELRSGLIGVLHPASKPLPDATSGVKVELLVASGGDNPQFKVP